MYNHKPSWRIKALQLIAALFIFLLSYSLLEISYTIHQNRIFLLCGLIMYCLPVVLRPNEHDYLLSMEFLKASKSSDAHEASIKNKTHLLHFAGNFFFLLWIASILLN